MTPLDYVLIVLGLLWTATAIWWIIAAVQLIHAIREERANAYHPLHPDKWDVE